LSFAHRHPSQVRRNERTWPWQIESGCRERPELKRTKVFWFFFSKKELLPSLGSLDAYRDGAEGCGILLSCMQ
jgi:hypothetical protein